MTIPQQLDQIFSNVSTFNLTLSNLSFVVWKLKSITSKKTFTEQDKLDNSNTIRHYITLRRNPTPTPQKQKEKKQKFCQKSVIGKA